MGGLLCAMKVRFNAGLITGLVVFATACQTNDGGQTRQAERSVQRFAQRRVEMRGAVYTPVSFKTRAYGNGGEYRYQVIHAYTITVDKGETMKEEGEFIVDSAGLVHEFGQP